MVIKKMKGLSIRFFFIASVATRKSKNGSRSASNFEKILNFRALAISIAWRASYVYLGDDDDDDGYDGEDDGANDVMIGDQNDDYYRHNSSNRHEASLVV